MYFLLKIEDIPAQLFLGLLETGVVKIACFFLKNVSGTGGNKNCPWFGGELFVATHRKMQL